MAEPTQKIVATAVDRFIGDRLVADGTIVCAIGARVVIATAACRCGADGKFFRTDVKYRRHCRWAMAKAAMVGDAGFSAADRKYPDCSRSFDVNGFVQRLKLCHLWVGLLSGWLLLLIILSGSLSFYRAELDAIQLFQFAGAPELNADDSTRARSAALAQTFLSQQAATATQWYIELPQVRKPYLTLHWLQPASTGAGANRQGQLYQQLLDAGTGQPLTAARPIRFGATDHQLGGLFFQLHYNLLHLLGPVSRSLVAYAALLWLLLTMVGLLSLRGRWRTLLQWRLSSMPAAKRRTLRHNQLALLTLPFAVLFASSGWITQMLSENNAPQRQLYPDNITQFYAELFPAVQPFAGTRPMQSAPLADLILLTTTAEQQWGLAVGKISITLPGSAHSTVLLTASAAAQVSNQLPQTLFQFSPSGWQQVASKQGDGYADAAHQTLIARIRSVWYGLHQSLYASDWLRFGLFVCGILCCWMIWLGLKSWSLRQSDPWLRQLLVSLHTVVVASIGFGSMMMIAAQFILPSGFFAGSLVSQLVLWMGVTAVLALAHCWRCRSRRPT